MSDAVKDLNIEHRVKDLADRIFTSHAPGMIKGFLKDCEKVLVVEEGEPFMEETVKAFAQEERLTFRLWGKVKTVFHDFMNSIPPWSDNPGNIF